MNPPCYVLCDANKQVGYGHFFRTKYLVNALEQSRNWHWLWCGNLTEDMQQQVTHHQAYRDVIEAANALQDKHAGVVVCDSYHLKAVHYATLSANHTVIVFDDFAPHTYKGVFCVINFCVAARSYHYQAQHQLLGPKYFITHPKLGAPAQGNTPQGNTPQGNDAQGLTPQVNTLLANKPSRQLRILIAMGGFDRFAVGRRLAEALVAKTNHSITNIHVTLLERDVATSSLYQVISFCDDMPSLYRQADVVISGGGLTKYESAFSHIPNVVIAQTDAQFAESVLFAKLGLCINYALAKNLHEQSIIEFVEWFTTNDWHQEQRNIVNASLANFDPHSTINVAQQLLTWLEQNNE